MLTSTSTIDEFVHILLNNYNNTKIHLSLDFLESGFDLFNFLIFLLIKLLCTYMKTASVLVEDVDLKTFKFMQECLKNANIKLDIDFKGIDEHNRLYIPGNNTGKVWTRQTGNSGNLENYSLNILSNKSIINLSFKCI